VTRHWLTIYTPTVTPTSELDILTPPLKTRKQKLRQRQRFNFLKQVKAKSDEGDVDWLRKRGKVYEAISVT
jgi:hypothetical protein